ncbi:hypothetical protein RND81_04G241800 [Saponaria officinalis]|uniref:Phytocyanin domain-containing protein n=1 Tax=Saponaria officinalis TaxID=3572 RepID=A0AAW1LQN8_SAPOF
MKKSINFAIIVAMVVATTMMTGLVTGRLVNVGGKDMWRTGINYTEWASHESFYVGDWLGFKFDKNQFDVIEVNETGYKDCNPNFMITNITRGAGRDIYELKEAKSYYFICTRGYCWGGMKVAINVTSSPPPTLSPHKNNSYTNCGPMHLLILVISVLIAFLINDYGY